MTNGVYKLSEVESEPIYRVRTGCAALDRMLGSTHFEENDVLHIPEHTQYGLPLGMVTLISGERGVGKSRLCIALTSSISFDNFYDYDCIYFQREVSIPQFKNWTLPFRHNDERFLVSDIGNVDEQIECIRKNFGKVVIVDSLNMVDDFCSSEAVMKDVMNKYKDIAKERNAAVILIGFLNKGGSTKGSSSIEHLVDVCVEVRNMDHDGNARYCKRNGKKYNPEVFKGCFAVTIPKKNRAGETGHSIIFRHTEKGISFVGSDLPNEY